MALHKPIINARLRENTSFIRDLRQFVKLPVQVSLTIADALGPSLRRALAPKELEALAERVDIKDEDAILRSASVLTFLAERVRVLGRRPEDVLQEIQAALGKDKTAPTVDPGLASVFAYTDEQRREALARRVLSTPPTYLGSTFRAVLVADNEEDVGLHLGCFWTISYEDSEGDERTLVFGMSPGELEEVATAIRAAQKSLETLEYRGRSARLEER